MLLWDLLGTFPGTDYESFNYEWIIGKLKELKDSVAAAHASEEAAADSASAAADSAGAAAGSAGLSLIYSNRSKDYRDEAQGFANDASDEVDSIQGVVNQVHANTASIDNLIATAGDGTVPSELTDLRVAYNGDTYSTAGAAVRAVTGDNAEDIGNLQHRLNKFDGYVIPDRNRLTKGNISASTSGWTY